MNAVARGCRAPSCASVVTARLWSARRIRDRAVVVRWRVVKPLSLSLSLSLSLLFSSLRELSARVFLSHSYHSSPRDSAIKPTRNCLFQPPIYSGTHRVSNCTTGRVACRNSGIFCGFSVRASFRAIERWKSRWYAVDRICGPDSGYIPGYCVIQQDKYVRRWCDRIDATHFTRNNFD